MEQEYNWDLILKVAVPISLIEAYAFHTNISDRWKWAFLTAGLLLAGALVYIKDRRKNSVFNAVAIVFLISLIARLLKIFGIF